MIASRNVSPYGYLALIGESMISIYLAYAEEDSATYDHVWTKEFSEIRNLNIGRRIELIDFSPNCEEFVSYMNTGELCLWSIKKKKFIKLLCNLNRKTQCPISELRVYNQGDSCLAFSKPNNILMIIDFYPFSGQGSQMTDGSSHRGSDK